MSSSALTRPTFQGTTSNITNPDSSPISSKLVTGMVVTDSPLMFRNRIINGDMRIDQRNSGASVTINTSASNYTLDRWQGYGQATDGVFTIQRVADAPSGFNNSLKVTVTTADASIGASQLYALKHRIEGYNVADLELGKLTAKIFTASFWIKSSVAGTYTVSFGNNLDRSYPTTYTVNSANTWEYKTVTVVGATDGTWNYENGTGLDVHFDLGSGTSVRGAANTWANYPYGVTGSASLISTNGASLQVTGVQLEAGPTATPFERRPIGVELQQCMRYYERNDSIETGVWWSGYTVNGTTYYTNEKFKVVKRATPAPIIILQSELNSFVSFSTSSQNIYGFRAQAAANSSNNMAYYRAAWAADAEL